jgi:hypothetical protein
MSMKSSFIVLLLLFGLLLGSVASIRARSEVVYAPQLSELGPTPGPFNPSQPSDEAPQRLDSSFVGTSG